MSRVYPRAGGPLKPADDAADLRLSLRPAEAARALGISPRTLWALTARGEVPHVRTGAVILYPLPALRRWLEERTQNPIIRSATAEGGAT